MKIRSIGFLCLIFLSSYPLLSQGDECVDAIDITSLFGAGLDVTMSSAVHHISTATAGDDDPTVGFDCFQDGPDLSRTMWFSFIGDGSSYIIGIADCSPFFSGELDNGQMALYEGDCSNLIPLHCNEAQWSSVTYGLDNPAITFATELGQFYKVLVDPFGSSTGSFCLKVQEVLLGDCESLYGGSEGGDRYICANSTSSTFTFGMPNDAVVPYSESESGVFIVFTSEPPIGEHLFWINDPSYLFHIGPYQDVTISLIQSANIPDGQSYYTPYLFMGAEMTPDWQGLDLGNACFEYGPSTSVFRHSDSDEMFTSEYIVDTDLQTITVEASGGSGHYSYEWSSTDPIVDGTTGDSASFDEDGIHVIWVTDNSDCIEDTIEHIVQIVTSQIQPSLSSRLTVFPNPSKDKITISGLSEEAHFKMYKIFNGIGQLLEQDNLRPEQDIGSVDVSHLSDGNYFLELTTERGESVIRKVMILR